MEARRYCLKTTPVHSNEYPPPLIPARARIGVDGSCRSYSLQVSRFHRTPLRTSGHLPKNYLRLIIYPSVCTICPPYVRLRATLRP